MNFDFMKIIDLKALIIGNRESYIKSGTFINLTCTINAQIRDINDNHMSPINKKVTIITEWYKDNKLVNNYEHSGMKIVIDKNQSISHLLISKASAHDSGFYTCSPRSGYNDTIIIHVINGEQSAAMQHGISNAIQQRFHWLFFKHFLNIFIQFFLFLF